MSIISRANDMGFRVEILDIGYNVYHGKRKVAYFKKLLDIDMFLIEKKMECGIPRKNNNQPPTGKA